MDPAARVEMPAGNGAGCNIGILIDIVDTISNSNVLVVRTLYSTTDLDFGSHRAHRVGGAKHSLVIRVARAVGLQCRGSSFRVSRRVRSRGLHGDR